MSKEHYILSNYLRASITFSIYAEIFSFVGIDHIYRPMEIYTSEKSKLSTEEFNALKEFLYGFRYNRNAVSVIVSNPFKQYAAMLCDELDGATQRIGIVSLITKRGKKLFGDNIDGEAFFIGQKETIHYDFNRKTIMILGCGGVSSAVSFKLAEIGVAQIYVFDTDKEKQETLYQKLKSYFPSINVVEVQGLGLDTFSKIDVIYNGTGIGKKSDNPPSILETPLPEQIKVPSYVVAIDANYTPWKTRFLQQCESYGCLVLNGFPHMIAFTSLHLSQVLASNIDFDFVKKIGERNI